MTFAGLDSPKRKDEDLLFGIPTVFLDKHILTISPLLNINEGLILMKA